MPNCTVCAFFLIKARFRLPIRSTSRAKQSGDKSPHSKFFSFWLNGEQLGHIRHDTVIEITHNP